MLDKVYPSLEEDHGYAASHLPPFASECGCFGKQLLTKWCFSIDVSKYVRTSIFPSQNISKPSEFLFVRAKIISLKKCSAWIGQHVSARLNFRGSRVAVTPAIYLHAGGQR